MGNLICSKKDFVKMSNAVTDSVFCAILTEGTKLAKTQWEKNLMVWIAERNQNILGIGIVGFRLEDIGLTANEFESQTNFMLQIFNNVLENKSWSRTGLRDEFGFNLFHELKNMTERLSHDDINGEPLKFWDDETDRQSHEICKHHQVYMGQLTDNRKDNCLFCTDLPLEAFNKLENSGFNIQES